MISEDQYEKNVLAQGGKIDDSFSGPNSLFTTPLAVGDEFEIPEKMKVYHQPVRNSQSMYQYIRTDVVNNGKDQGIKNIGPSVFNRTLQEVDEKGNPTGRILSCDGTAHDEFVKYGDLNDAFKAIQKKKLQIKDRRTGLTRGFNGNLTTTSVFYTVDIEK